MDSDNFGETGYGVIPSFLNPDEIGLFASRIEALLSAPLHPGMSRPGNDLLPLRWCDEIVARILNSDRRLRRLSRVLKPNNLKWISGYLSTKQPHSPPLVWHQDWWCWDHPISFRRPPPQVALLCYLTDTDAQTGALRVLARSHRQSLPIHHFLPEPHGIQANELAADHPALSDVPGQITLALRAGDAAVIDYRLLHGTHANNTATRRDCILLSFVPAWRDLPTEIKAHLIGHPALPGEGETAIRQTTGYDQWLPSFNGFVTDLPVNRIPPTHFTVQD